MIIVNPGTGPVPDSTEDEARRNLAALIEDVGVSPVTVGANVEQQSDGRWSFLLKHGGRECWVEMPGIPLDQVRYMGSEGQNVWHFPRLYVDGSSWLWMYAISSVRSALTGEEE